MTASGETGQVNKELLTPTLGSGSRNGFGERGDLVDDYILQE